MGWKECPWGTGFFGQVEIIRISTSPMPTVFIYLICLNFTHFLLQLKTNIAINKIFFIWSEHIFILLFYTSVTLSMLFLVFKICDKCLCPRWIWQLMFSIFLLIFVFKVFHGIIFLKLMSHYMLKVQFLTQGFHAITYCLCGCSIRFFLFFKKAFKVPSTMRALITGRVPYKTLLGCLALCC